MIATSSAASWLYRSSDAGKDWTTVVTENDGGAGWADLGFTSGLEGEVIHGPADEDDSAYNLGRLLLTDDGGRTWHAITF